MTDNVDKQAIRALYQQQMDGWNTGDGEAFAAPFTDQCSFVAFDGTTFDSRASIVEFHDPLFKTHLKGTRLAGEVTDVRFLAPGVALARATGSTVMPGEAGPKPARDSIQTLVAVQEAGGWKLTAFQNTRIRPIGRDFAGTVLWLLSDKLWNVTHPGRSSGQS
jgi:uncharacterized protein (TIGR02246 family)